MSDGLSRRHLLAGLGVAGGASVMGLRGSAGAAPAPTRAGGGFSPVPPGVSAGARLGASDTLTPGLTYRLIDFTTWQPAGDTTFRSLSVDGVGIITAQGQPLFTSVDPPIGAVLKEVSLWYQSATADASVGLYKKPLAGPVAGNGPMGPTPVAMISPLPPGAGTLQATLAVNETIDGSGTYPLVFFPSTPTQLVAAVRFGFVAPPTAFVPSAPIVRVLDTRVQGGKLNVNEERVVVLGVPAVARAAVINLTVTGTEDAGFVAVFPADAGWDGNSSINWSQTGQILANSVVTATDATGHITLRAGVARTDVVIDLQGYLL